jgi:O-antigen ligase
MGGRNESKKVNDRASSTKMGTAAFFLLCLVVAFGVVAYGAVDPLATSLIAVLLFIVVSLWAIESWRSGSIIIPATPLLIPIGGLAAVGLIQLLPLESAMTTAGVTGSEALSLDPFATRMFVVSLVLLMIFFSASLIFVDSPKRLRKLLIFLLSFGTLMAFFGVLQKLAAPDAIYGLRPTPQAIPFGSYVNQHHFASLMVMLSGPAVGLMVASGIRRDLLPLLLIASGMMAIALLFTGSRGGVISYVAMLGVVALTARKSATIDPTSDEGADSVFARLAAPAGFLLLAAVVAGMVILLGAGENLLRGFGLTGGVDDVTSGRLYFWSIALKIFADHPILGAGLDAFGVAFTQYDTRNGLFRVEQAHNEYLQILADAGIVGLAFVVGFIGVFVRQAVASVSSASSKMDLGVRVGALAGCIGVMVHSIFDFPLRTPANAYVFLVLTVIAVQPISLQSSKNRRRSR